MQNKKIKYRLGFDLGYTSIGWAALKLDDNYQVEDFIDFGVRIFPSGRDAKSKEPTSVTRREKRGARRNRDRYLKRRQRLLNLMIKLGLQPDSKKARKSLSQKEPLAIRSNAVKEKVALHDIGRALFHINQRRGFKSNRVADRKENSDTKDGLLGGVDNLEKLLKETKNKQNDKGITLGEYLFTRLDKGKNTRLKAGENQYDLWTSRKMYLDEFNKIVTEQQKHYPEILNYENIKKLRKEIFHQRELKLQEPGFCSLIDGEKRARSAYPESQLVRIYQEVNNLEIVAENIDTQKLTNTNRKEIVKYLTEDFKYLTKQKILSWAKLQKIIGIKGIKFNLDTQGRKGLKANSTEMLMQSALGSKWNKLKNKEKHHLIDALLLSQSNEELIDELNKLSKKSNIQFTENEQNNLQHLTGLEEGFGRVSLAAINKILPQLKKWQIYSDACKTVGINHSDDRTGELFPELPYYGEILPKAVIGGTYNKSDIPEKRYGKINNPTVHMALNQFKVVLNDLINRFGCPPEEIHVEMARETSMSAKQLNDYNKQQSENKKKNDNINKILDELGVHKNYANRMKYKLWEDLNKSPDARCCPLIGKTINHTNLFSAEVEIEHIIPFSISFDDGRNNKMVCFKSANQDKANKTPHEAFSSNPNGYNWDEILGRAKEMPASKFKRFLPDALEWFKETEDGKYIARMLNDTKYMSRIARKYAESVTTKVTAIKGKFTSDLRHEWGLDRFTHNYIDGKWTKDRTNHHHHAIDALVVALTNVNTMQKVSKANKNANEHHSSRLYLNLDKPYSSFDTKEIENKLLDMVISHKPDHKNVKLAKRNGTTIGQLHEDTNYGHIVENIYATRKELTMKNFGATKNIEEIASVNIRAKVNNIFEKHSEAKGNKRKLTDKKSYEQKLNIYKKQTNVKRVRIHLNKPDLIPVYDKKGKAYRHVLGGNNFCAEIYCNKKGEKAGKWQCEVFQNYYVNQKGFIPKWRQKNATAYKVMRLQINDMLAIDKNGKRIIYLITGMGTSKQIFVVHQNNTNLKTSFKASSLQNANARKLYISPTGKIYDPGTARKPK